MAPAPGGIDVTSLPWTAQLALFVVAMWGATKIVEQVTILFKVMKAGSDTGSGIHPPPADENRVELLRKLQAEVLSTYLQGSVLPILARQTEILEGIRGMCGQHHETLTRLTYQIDEMRAQQGRTHDGVHKLTNAVHDLLSSIPKRRDDLS